MPRLATLLAALLLAFPAAAFAQGAGDDQYQDPFGDEPARTPSTAGGDGLSDEPPVGGGASSGGSGGGSGSTGAPGGGSAGTGAPGTAPSASTPPAETGRRLPDTGSDPRILVLLGAAMVLTGIGLRLRTIDPDAF